METSANQRPPGQPLVTVVIPCYNQGEYLAAAIDSVAQQSYPHREIIVVDDGSSDDTRRVASGKPQVVYLFQQNQGLSAARNTGIEHARGDLLVFLDADDRLLPNALEIGIEIMSAHPGCAFAWGHHRHIDGRGTISCEYPPEPTASDDHYLALLMNNCIGMHATVIYRRVVFDTVGLFDTSLGACEDYDMYLRIAREQPIVRHQQMVAEYRHHDENMSRDCVFMAKLALAVLDLQRPFIGQDPSRRRAYRTGVRNWVNYYRGEILRTLGDQIRARQWSRAWDSLRDLVRYLPLWFSRSFH